MALSREETAGHRSGSRTLSLSAVAHFYVLRGVKEVPTGVYYGRRGEVNTLVHLLRSYEVPFAEPTEMIPSRLGMVIESTFGEGHQAFVVYRGSGGAGGVSLREVMRSDLGHLHTRGRLPSGLLSPWIVDALCLGSWVSSVHEGLWQALGPKKIASEWRLTGTSRRQHDR